MSSTLFIYSSNDGQTKKICDAMAQQVSDAGTSVECLALEQAQRVQWENIDKVIIGASIRYGHFNKQLDQFIAQNQQHIEQRINGFFCVNLTARKPEKSTPSTNAYMMKFLEKSPWQPQLQAVFAGALRYSIYRWYDKFMIRLIMKITGGETDTSRDIEYTDWKQVANFANEIMDAS